MYRKSVIVLIAAIVCMLSAGVLHAGPVFDDLLNYPIIDQKCIGAEGNGEALGLAGHGKAQVLALTKETPLGQTIKLGSKADKLWRIGVGICYYEDNWQAGEEVTFTLWDSPKKVKKLYSRTLDAAHKWHKWDIPFDVQLRAKPNAQYFFEITHNGGGDNKINVVGFLGNIYKRGQAYVSGKPRPDTDLYFVQISKPKGDRKANLKRFFSRLDFTYPPLAEAGRAYKRGNYDLACKLIVKEFDNRTQPDSLAPKPIPADKLDTIRADLLCAQGRYYHKPKLLDYWIDMNSQTNWRETWPNSANYVRQNDLFRELGEAYQATHNEKYAKKINELMADYIQDNSSPYEGGIRGGRWVAMFVGWRLGDAWEGYGAACKSKSLTDDVKLGWIDYQARMGHFVELEPSGANQENASAECLMDFAYRFPEFKDAKKWQKQGYDRLITNSLDLFRPDGGSKEPTMNYQGYALGFLRRGLEKAEKYHLKVPAEIYPRVEKINEYCAYILDPRGHGPANGDTNCQDFRASVPPREDWHTSQAGKAAETYHREDFTFIASAGKEGKRPTFNSFYFPDTRYFIMRSDWGGENGKDFEQARYLLFRGGYDGGHSHSDYNQITLYAYGRSLIIDPGRTGYGTPLQFELERERSHNVLLVDDLPMKEEDATPVLHAWHATPVMDFLDNSYPGVYPGVEHRRAVVFVRPDYFVMFDSAIADKPHKMGINFWLTPPDATIDREKATVRSNDPDGANVLLKVMGSSAIEVADRKGSLDLGGVRNDIPVVTFWQNGLLQADFTTLMYPLPAHTQAPTIAVTNANVAGCRTCMVTTPLGIDYIFYTPALLGGATGVIRKSSDGKVYAFAMVDSKEIRSGDLALAACETVVKELSVTYSADAVEVTCPGSYPSVAIATLGRAKAVVNGVERAISGDTFKPFVP